jgi:hypothetical protein
MQNASFIIVPEVPENYKIWAEELMSEWEKVIENPPGRRLVNLRTRPKFREKLRYRLWKAINQLKPALKFNNESVKGMKILT